MKVDLRIIKTKKNLYDSLLKLMSKKTFEEIKVSDICKEALVNRSTFYSHFNDKYELLSSFLDDLRSNLEGYLNKTGTFRTVKDYYINMIEVLLNHIDENYEVYSMIIKNNQNSIVMDMLNNTLYEDINKHIKEIKSKDIPASFITNFYIGAVINIGITYLKERGKYTKKEILNYLIKLLPDNI